MRRAVKMKMTELLTLNVYSYTYFSPCRSGMISRFFNDTVAEFQTVKESLSASVKL